MKKLLLIRERDVGMFSLFLQVLNTLYLLEDKEIDRVPIVLFGQGCIYFHDSGYQGKKTVWEYYFEPLDQNYPEAYVLDLLGERALEILESVRKGLDYLRGLREFPHRVHLLAPLTERDQENMDYANALEALSNCIWASDFMPVVDGKAAAYAEMPRADRSDLVRRYVRFRPHIANKISEFYDQHLKGHYVIGVHVRGTDGHSAPARGVDIPFDAYFAAIEGKFAEIGRDRCRLFLATDEQAIISLFADRFGEDLVYYDAIRKVDGDEIFGKGPTGQVLPGYITGDKSVAVRNGEDVVVEYGLLCRSDCFFHNESSISRSVRISVPESTRL